MVSFSSFSSSVNKIPGSFLAFIGYVNADTFFFKSQVHDVAKELYREFKILKKSVFSPHNHKGGASLKKKKFFFFYSSSFSFSLPVPMCYCVL